MKKLKFFKFSLSELRIAILSLLLLGAIIGATKIVAIYEAKQAVPDYSGFYQALPNGVVMANHAQLWGRAWSSPVLFSNDNSGVSCDALSEADGVSNCVVTLDPLKRNEIYPDSDAINYAKTIGEVGRDARVVLVTVKLKAWANEANSYCQIALRAGPNLNLFSGSDYANHVEVYGDKNYKLSGRRISYVTLPIPLNDSGRFTMQFMREIQGACETSAAVTVQGFFK